MKEDRDLQQYRDLMQPPSVFEEGFNWTSLAGALFIGLLMVPGSIYMHLVSGQDVGGAARWVTVILFLEVARRTHKTLKNAEIFVLFYMAAAATAVPFEGLLFRQFFVDSKAVISQGWQDQIPIWYAPTDPEVLAQRNFFSWQWLPAVGMVVLFSVLHRLDARIIGFGLFKVVSDRERLPFPLAPIGAQGVLALAEEGSETSWRWRAFSIGGAIGLLFGLVYLGIPILSHAILGVTISALPIPFADTTGNTENLLPAVATGISFDATHLFVGMVMPFWAVVGSFIGLIATVVINPALYRAGILSSWQHGDGTVTTLFKNTVDFYFSLGIGLSMAVAAIGIWALVQSVRRARAKRLSQTNVYAIPKDRGDIPNWAVLTVYLISCSIYIGISGYLIEWHRGVMTVLLIYALIYTPLVSFVTARLEGLCGQALSIPLAREAGMILSGYQGLKIWFLPIPMANYGEETLFYRQAELTGTRFWSIWKADLILVPFILICSIFFANFIWSMGPVPSSAYPYADKIWDLQAMNQSLIYSSTTGQSEFSQFRQAINPWYIGTGFALGATAYATFSAVGLPVLLVYGFVQGMGQSLPHSLLLTFIGACMGRYYFRPRFGDRWLQVIPVVTAGFSCGMGLISMSCIGIQFLTSAVTTSQY
jgi:hypothetical protein